MSFAIFDENYYLFNYPDVKAAVDAGAFSSGLDHFQKAGLAEGRVLVSPVYNEQLYLQKYPDVGAAVAAGAFSSGLQHYIQSGEAEGRSSGAFDERLYLLDNPDVGAAVAAGAFSSGLQHYIQAGQFEEDRAGYFTGTSGNDIVAVAGEGNTAIVGVPFETLLSGVATAGVGEADTLIGGAGSDTFLLGFPSLPPIIPTSQQLYVGGGDTDNVRIQNFERFDDSILLPGLQQDYSFQTINGNFQISTASGDLIGVVEGVPSLLQVPSDALSDLAGVSTDSVGPFIVLA